MSIVEQAIAKLRTAEQQAPKPVARITQIDAGGVAGRAADPENTLPGGTNRVLAIDTGALREAGYLPELAGERQIAEHFRHIKRPVVERAVGDLSGHAQDADARIIMVTSGIAGEGKTFTSINLALSLARERDMSVLLVDADILKPHVSRIFGLTREPGLMSALVDPRLSVESLIIPTDVRGLSLLPAGAAAEGAAEQLLSDRMREMLRQLLASNPRRIILLDSPPLLVTSEGKALTKIAGQVLFVVRVGKTPEQVVKDALALVDKSRLGGIIVNEARISLSESYYGYGKYGNEDADAGK